MVVTKVLRWNGALGCCSVHIPLLDIEGIKSGKWRSSSVHDRANMFRSDTGYITVCGDKLIRVGSGADGNTAGEWFSIETERSVEGLIKVDITGDGDLRTDVWVVHQPTGGIAREANKDTTAGFLDLLLVSYNLVVHAWLVALERDGTSEHAKIPNPGFSFVRDVIWSAWNVVLVNNVASREHICDSHSVTMGMMEEGKTEAGLIQHQVSRDMYLFPLSFTDGVHFLVLGRGSFDVHTQGCASSDKILREENGAGVGTDKVDVVDSSQKLCFNHPSPQGKPHIISALASCSTPPDQASRSGNNEQV